MTLAMMSLALRGHREHVDDGDCHSGSPPRWQLPRARGDASAFRPGVTVCACIRFACVIRSGYLVLANQHTSSEGQGSRDLRQTRVEPY